MDRQLQLRVFAIELAPCAAGKNLISLGISSLSCACVVIVFTLSRFVLVKDICPLLYFILIPQRDNEFWAGVFFDSDEDLAVCEKNGVTEIFNVSFMKSLNGKVEDKEKILRLLLNLTRTKT